MPTKLWPLRIWSTDEQGAVKFVDEVTVVGNDDALGMAGPRHFNFFVQAPGLIVPFRAQRIREVVGKRAERYLSGKTHS